MNAHTHHHDSATQSGHGGKHDHHDHHAHMITDFKKRFWITLILTVPIVILAPMLQQLAGYEWRFRGDRYVQFGIATIAFFYGGWPFLKGLSDEVKAGKPGMMTLIALAIAVAYFYSSAVVFGVAGKIFFWELVSLIDIMLLGHWIEMKSVMGASNALQELARLMPSTALKINDSGETKEVRIDDLAKGDRVLVRPGEKIPADGTVRKGESHVNESMITGESVPVRRTTGDEVIGGSVNGNGSLTVEVRHTGADAYLSKVIGMVQAAQESKSKTQDLANRAAGWLFYVSLGAGLITLITWLSVGKDFEYALERMVTVMIIACPHALGLAVPLVVAISTAVSAKNGLLIRNRTAFENARKLTVVLFDKTGTLTRGAFGLTRFDTLEEAFTKEDVLQMAAAIESASEHPIGAGIVRKADEMKLGRMDVSGFENITGQGVRAQIADTEYVIAGPGFLKKNNLEIPANLENNGSETLVFLLRSDGKTWSILGYLALADEVRSESFHAVEDLKKRGIRVIMLTGDNEQVARSVSETLQLDAYHAGVLPEDKERIIRDLQEEGEFVAMTGDGVNDAPALARADVGIAIGSGTDVAAETADIILVNSDPQDVVRLIDFGAATYRKVVQNLFWAAGYNIVAIPLAAGALFFAGIILSPAAGAVLMSLSTVIVAINARLLRRKMQ